MEAFEQKMKARGCTDAAIAAFRLNYEQLVAGVTGMVPETDIDAVNDLPRLGSLARGNVDEKALLAETVVLKLNGGLGTSMGLEKAKSLLEVKDGASFLDLIAQQVKVMRTKFGSNVKFVLMNSFSTSADTFEALKAKHAELAAEDGLELLQNMSPKVDAATMAPATHPEAPDLEWCPPGHGDIYPSLLGSGLLQRLLDTGFKYLFVSNSDNLGATLDLDLLAYFASSGKGFVMEVCERTASDKKGGHLCVRKADGKFMLRESAMCPDDDMGAFQDISKHKFFNTNNLWINLQQLQATLDASGGVMKLPLIKNKKTVNPRDSASAKVLQLETAMGSAIECFNNAGAVVVPRTRFAPVKTCNDLFCLRSDCYAITPDFTVEPVVPKLPLVKLDDKHYKLVDKMVALVDGYPAMQECVSLTVSGPVKFAKGSILKGKVSVKNAADAPVELPAGEYVDVDVDLTAGVPATAPVAA